MATHLLHIGYTKSGSSFLQKWFDLHPELAYVHQSVSGFNKTIDISNQAGLGQTDKIKYFVTSDEDFCFWKGPVDPVGLRLKPYPVKEHQKKVCHLLGDMLPGAKVLIIVRGFESVIQSAYSQFVRAGGELTFREWLDTYVDLMKDFWDFDYLTYLYQQVFGKDQVMILPYEALSENPREFLSEIEKRLNISHIDFDSSKVNPALSRHKKILYQRMNRRMAKWCDRLPNQLRLKIFNTYQNNLIRGKLDPALNFLDKLTGKKSMDMSFPEDFLEQFRGLADQVVQSSEFTRFESAYLTSDSVVKTLTD